MPEHIAEIPYHVIPLQWEIAPCPGNGESPDEGFSRVYRGIAVRLQELMLDLRGEEAN